MPLRRFRRTIPNKMPQADKALAKILSGSSDANISFIEATSVLNRVGFHPDGRKVILPRQGNSIKAIYIKQIRKLLI